MKKKNLSNHLLVAMPHINDTIFNKSVILLNDHSDKGAMGFIINKPIKNEKNTQFLFDKIEDKLKKNIYFGGPVNLEACFILHDNSYNSTKTIQISKEISLTISQKIINDIELGDGPQKFKFNMGYAGWDKGQLEKEIKSGDWLVLPTPKKFIFDIPDNEKWTYSINSVGLDLTDPGWTPFSGEA